MNQQRTRGSEVGKRGGTYQICQAQLGTEAISRVSSLLQVAAKAKKGSPVKLLSLEAGSRCAMPKKHMSRQKEKMARETEAFSEKLHKRRCMCFDDSPHKNTLCTLSREGRLCDFCGHKQTKTVRM